MDIDWDRWQDIESRQNRFVKDVDFHRERLDTAGLNLRNTEMALLRGAEAYGVFRRLDQAAWLADVRKDPADALRRHKDHPIENIMVQFVESTVALSRARAGHAKASEALAGHSPAFFRLRDWIRDQQSRGVL